MSGDALSRDRREYPRHEFAADCGGTASRITTHSSWTGALPSLNPASTDRPSEAWTNLLEAVVERCGNNVLGWIASASVTAASIDREEARLREASRDLALEGTVWLSNDMIPPLLADPLCGVGLVAGVGTGSSFLGRDADGRTARASGLEYVLTDEGGAFDAGWRALKAAGRAWDGRGPETVLVKEAVAWGGSTFPELGDRLAHEARLKPVVASFAPVVCEAAAAGDLVAASIVESLCDAIRDGVAAVLSRLGPGIESLVVVGGLASECAIVRAKLEQLAGLGLDVTIVRDGAGAALSLLDRAQGLDDEGEIAGLPWREVRL